MDKVTESKLKKEYDEFIKTESGKQWINHWKKEIGDSGGGTFGDYLYDFYPEELL